MCGQCGQECVSFHELAQHKKKKQNKKVDAYKIGINVSSVSHFLSKSSKMSFSDYFRCWFLLIYYDSHSKFFLVNIVCHILLQIGFYQVLTPDAGFYLFVILVSICPSNSFK